MRARRQLSGITPGHDAAGNPQSVYAPLYIEMYGGRIDLPVSYFQGLTCLCTVYFTPPYSAFLYSLLDLGGTDNRSQDSIYTTDCNISETAQFSIIIELLDY